MNYVCKGSKKNLKHKNNLHIISIEGRSLIRTFLAGATKDAAVYEMSDEQAQNKKLSLNLVLSKRIITFAPDDEP